MNATMVNPLIDEPGALRSQLEQSTETVAAIRASLAKAAEGPAWKNELSKSRNWPCPVVATLGEIDSHLGESVDRLSDMRAKGQLLKAKTHTYIVTAGILTVSLIAWMAAGQVFMCRYGGENDWRCQSAACPQSQGPSTPVMHTT